jgi:tetratricopeptide (TPR) repeat protein
MPHLIWIMCVAAASLSSPAQVPRTQQPETHSIPASRAPSTVMVEGPQLPQPTFADASAHELEIAGDEQRSKKAFSDAIEYYHLAMRKADSAELHNKTGISYLQLLQLKVAEKEFNHALKMKHDYAEARNNLGVICYMRKKYVKAISEYEKALKLSDTSAPFHSNLAMAYFEKKEFDKATVEMVRALELDPQIFERQSSGGIAARMASPEDRARYSYTLARIFAQKGIYERSLQYLKKAVEEGYRQINDVYTDEGFAGLRKDPRFAAVMAKTEPLPN